MKHMLGDIKLGSMYAFIPELYLCGWTLFLLMYGVYRIRRIDNFMIGVSILLLMVSAWVACAMADVKLTVMNGMFLSDRFTVFAKCLILISSAITLLLSASWLKEGKGQPFEFIILLLFSTLGMMLMVSSNDFLTMYMAFELASLPLYVLAAFSRDHTRSSEAGLKYFVLGALASGMMLFGMSLVYGFTGTTSFESIARLIAENDGVMAKGAIIGMVMIIVGLCFKVSAVPFHMWTPDVYEGAPTPVTAFFATAPKVAALLLFVRVMLQPFGELLVQWQQVLILVSILSMFVGALAGMVQTSFKRLLAYSSIGHVGFMLIGLAAGTVQGASAIMIYLALYIFMSAGAFGCLLLMQRNGHYVEKIKDISGLAQTHPIIAFTIALFMFSMAGIPPMAGFFGKMFIIQAAIAANLSWLAVVGVITSVISGYYYIKIVKIMYFDDPSPSLDKRSFKSVRLGVACSAAVTALYFLVPTPLISGAKLAAEALLQ